MKTRRRTISDKLITEELYFKVIEKLISTIDDDVELTQKVIINKLIPLKVSNNIIARVINDLLPEARATANSVASQIKSFKRQTTMLDELINAVEIYKYVDI